MGLPASGSCKQILSNMFRSGLTILLAAGVSYAATNSAYIRVNQVGYATAATKRAYLMSTAAETGATFAVKSGASTVYSAAIGANLGKWGTFSFVYALDFDSLSTTGTYTISVASPVAASSPSFKIDSATNIYSTPLANSLFYYESSRDGANYIPNSLRTAPGHLNDQNASAYFTPAFSKNDNSGPLTATGAVLDASGGWWDAGDYLKFVETHSYTVALMLAGVRDFPGQMGSGSAASNFTSEARFGLDWLQKMWVDSSKTLYYQVGVGSGGRNFTGDHDIWRLPQADDNWQGVRGPVSIHLSSSGPSEFSRRIGSIDQPQPGGAIGGRFCPLLQSVRAQRYRIRESMPTFGRTHF